MVGEHSLINFEKRRKVAIVLTRLQQVRTKQRRDRSLHLVFTLAPKVEDGTCC